MANTHYLEFTIDHTKVPSDQSDFIVYLDFSQLGGTHGFWSRISSGGGEIRCYNEAGTTEYAREIVDIDSVNKTGEVHVKVSGTLSSTVDQKIRVEYGDTGLSDYAVTATYGRNNVWTARKAVWSLNEDPSGTAPQMIDSTGGGADATAGGGMASSDLITGQVGQAWGFDDAEYASYDRFDLGTNNVSIGVWARWTISTGAGIVGAPRAAGANRYGIHQESGTLRYTFSTNLDYVVSGSAANDGSWHHIVMTVSRGSANGVKGYLDGSLDTEGSTPNTIAIDGTANPIWRFSAYNGGNGETLRADLDLEGDISRAWIAFSTVSADWITTEYNNQNAPSTFYTVSAEQTISGGATLTAADVTSTSSIDGTTITQTHILTAADVTSTSTIDGSTITKGLVFYTADIAITPRYDSTTTVRPVYSGTTEINPLYTATITTED